MALPTIITPVTPAFGGTVVGGTDGALAAATATDGDRFLNTGYETLTIINKSASPITVTVTTPKETVEGLDIENPVWTLGANKRYDFPPFKPSLYNDGSGYVTFVCSAVTTVTVGVSVFVPL
jgi:hypothetical protein